MTNFRRQTFPESEDKHIFSRLRSADMRVLLIMTQNAVQTAMHKKTFRCILRNICSSFKM